MRYREWLLVLLCVFSSSFVFGKSNEEIALDKIIATHEEIKTCDEKLNNYYNRLSRLYGLEERESLKKEQIAWLKERNTCISNPEKIKEKYKERVEILRDLFNRKTLGLVITDQFTINTRDPIINGALRDCDLEICKLYGLFFDYCNGGKTSAEIEKIKTQLIPFANELLPNAYNLDRFLECLKINEMDDAFLWLLTSPQHQLFEWAAPFDRTLIPLWLVFQNSKTLDYLHERGALSVKTSHSIEDLPAFCSMRRLMREMAHGRWATTSYCSHRGSIYWDLIAGDIYLSNRLSYTPAEIKIRKSIEGNLAPLKAWSLEGIRNHRLFKKFEVAFGEAVSELERYYKTSYHLGNYANQAALLLSVYVFNSFSEEGISSHKAFQAFGGFHDSIEGLKVKTKDFREEEWNEALSIAILNDYPLRIIEWIIDAGAKVNSTFQYEFPLMKAVARPDILRLLLNKGAEIDGQTPYGKTALFYAIQYGPLEAVKILVEKGANVNHTLKNFEELKKVYEEEGDFFLLEKVADFTPLIYSLAEENDEKMLFLLSHGAMLGNAAKGKIEKWILAHSEIEKEKLNQRWVICSVR